MDYEKAWAFLKEDLKDVKSHSKKFKVNQGDSYSISEEMSDRLLHKMDVYEEHIGFEPVVDEDTPLKGYDWGELLDKFGIEEYEMPDNYNYSYLSIEDVLTFGTLYNYIKSNFRNDEVIEVLKDHLRAMIGQEQGLSNTEEDEYTHYDAVWNAMLDIEDDDVFMQFVLALLGHMWT